MANAIRTRARTYKTAGRTAFELERGEEEPPSSNSLVLAGVGHVSGDSSGLF